MNLHKGITAGLTIRQTLVKVYRAYEKKGPTKVKEKRKEKRPMKHKMKATGWEFTKLL